MAAVWTDIAESLWSRYLNRVEWVSAYADHDPDGIMYAMNLSDEARVALLDHLEETDVHPATLSDTDRDALLARLIDLGARLSLKVGPDTVRSVVEQLVAARRPSMWSAVVYADPVGVPTPEIKPEVVDVLSATPIEDLSVIVAMSHRYLRIRFTIPMQSPAHADLTIASVADALLSSSLIQTESVITHTRRI